MAETRYRVVVRGPDLAERGPIPYLQLTMIPRFSAVGTWQLTFDAGAEIASEIEPGGGICVYRIGDSLPFFSGIWLGNVLSATGDSDVQTVTLAGSDDNWWLSTRFIYPDPTALVSAQSTLSYYTATDVLETAVKDLVSLNIGPSALAARQAGITIDTDLARGSTVHVSSRFDQLDTYLQSIMANTGYGYRVVQSGGSLEFQVYLTTDLSDTITLSRARGNLADFSLGLTAPGTTAAAIAGGGTGTSRTILEAVNTAAETEWGFRVETFVDKRDTTDTAELTQAGVDAITAGVPVTSLAITPIDVVGMAYGTDYNLGDTIGVEVGSLSVADVVRQVTITDNGGSASKVVPLVGTDNAFHPSVPQSLTTIRDLEKRIRQLERRF